MTVTVSNTPRFLARIPSRILLLRVAAGSVRIGQSQDEIMNGGGIPVSVSDGIQNWIMPETDVWIVGDAADNRVEILLP
jgi:hypothetical protein